MPVRLLAALLLLAAATTPRAQPTSTPAGLAERIEDVLEDRAFDDAYWGVQVVNLDTGTTLFDWNGAKRFIPASNMKLLTTAAALDALGPGFRYRTRLYADGDVQNGTLRGDLVVRGAGDPTFGGRFQDDDLTRVFRQWADSLRDAGIRRVQGVVVGDDDIFDNVHLGEGWQWDDLVWYYGAEVSGLQFGEGTVDVRVVGTSPGEPARIEADPNFGYARFVNRSTTTAGGGIREGYSRALSDNVFTVTASVPAGSVEREALAVVNPTEYFVSTMVGVFEQRGIEVDGDPVDVDEWGRRPRYETMRRVASHDSPTLAEIAAETNTSSNNVYAEHLLRTLGSYVYRGTDLPTGSSSAGYAAMAPFLDSLGIDPESFRVADGSGLSALNRLTPDGVNKVLGGMYHHPDRATREAFYDSLPLGGFTGTIRNRYRSGDARGNVRAKTGYISGARALSGYVTSAAGDRIAFSLLCNNYTVPHEPREPGPGPDRRAAGRLRGPVASSRTGGVRGEVRRPRGRWRSVAGGLGLEAAGGCRPRGRAEPARSSGRNPGAWEPRTCWIPACALTREGSHGVRRPSRPRSSLEGSPLPEGQGEGVRRRTRPRGRGPRRMGPRLRGDDSLGGRRTATCPRPRGGGDVDR